MTGYPNKIARISGELVLGIDDGVLAVLDIESCKITHSHKLLDADGGICDLIVLDSTHFLLASGEGVFKVTKSGVIKHFFEKFWVACICHVTESVYLLSLPDWPKLIVWNEHSDQQLFEIESDTVSCTRRIPNT
jgi:hypothetical protein